MSRVLVTGGAGFLGSHIADELSNQGYDVTLLDIRESAYKRHDQKMIVGDILDVTSLESVFQSGFDFVFHLAALADLNEAKNMPHKTVTSNILGTVNLLELSNRFDIKRFVFGSSVYVYSQQGGFYRCSKQACENYIEEFERKYGLSYTILRYGSLYGPRTDSSNGVFRLLQQALAGNEIDYPGAPDDKREYIHASDAAKLSVAALAPEYLNKHLTLTGNDKLTVSELFTMFSEILNMNVRVKYRYTETSNSGHYSITPYTFIPKLGKKIVSNEYVDMGQGLIQVIEMIYNGAGKNAQ